MRGILGSLLAHGYGVERMSSLNAERRMTFMNWGIIFTGRCGDHISMAFFGVPG